MVTAVVTGASQEKGTQGEWGGPGDETPPPSTPLSWLQGSRCSSATSISPPALAQHGALAWQGAALQWPWRAGLIGLKPAVKSPWLVTREDEVAPPPPLETVGSVGAGLLNLCTSHALNQVILSFPSPQGCPELCRRDGSILQGAQLQLWQPKTSADNAKCSPGKGARKTAPMGYQCCMAWTKLFKQALR